MYFGRLNETVVIIDNDYLSEQIEVMDSKWHQFLPDAVFQNEPFLELLLKLAYNARILERGKVVDVIIAYTVDNPTLKHQEPKYAFDFDDLMGIEYETSIGIFKVRSFFADEGEICSEHFDNVLDSVYQNESVSRIIMVADHPKLNGKIQEILDNQDVSVFCFTRELGTNINLNLPSVVLNLILPTLNNKYIIHRV